jgi:hypothetical protein
VIKVDCPKGGAELKIHVDLSEGPPDEVGTECDCGAIPVWGLKWDFIVELGDFLYDERGGDGDTVKEVVCV